MIKQKATNVTWHEGHVSPEERQRFLGQKGATLWLTGLSGSGKSTIACALEQALLQMGRNAYRLDGDNVRHGLNKNLGFSADDRAENIRRIGEVARLFADGCTIAITGFISPYRADRDQARALHDEMGLPFIEVYVECPLDVAEQRDPKGLYKKARAGEIKHFTGIDDPYEAPENPELVIHTAELTVAQSVDALLEYLKQHNLIETD